MSRLSSVLRTAHSRLPAILAAAGTESSSSERGDPSGEAQDAATLAALAAAVGREPGGWLLNTDGWRSVAEERRYLRALKRHPDAAVFAAEEDGVIVGRLSIARDPHQASRHVADLGLMVADGHRRRGIGRALLEQAVAWAREAGVRKLELHVFPGTSRRFTSTSSSASSARGCARTITAGAASTSTGWIPMALLLPEM